MGAYKPASLLPSDSTGYIDMRCTCSGLDCVIFTFSIGIQGGTSGDATRRTMKHATRSDTLTYGLFRDATRLLNWGVDGQALGGTYLLGQFGVSQRTNVYGRIPPGQVVPVGTYSDAPAVVITY